MSPRHPGHDMSSGSERSLSIRWIVLALLVVAALIVGSGALDATTPTLQRRAAALDARLKCPACEDLSVAESTAPSSLAVRREVAQRLAEGQSDQQIISALTDQYGQSVLLTPSGGLSVILWAVPAAAAIVVVVVVLVVARRRGTTLRGAPRSNPSKTVP